MVTMLERLKHLFTDFMIVHCYNCDRWTFYPHFREDDTLKLKAQVDAGVPDSELSIRPYCKRCLSGVER